MTADIKPESISLYLITDDKRSLGRSALEVARAAAGAGVKMIQYRPWQVSDDECGKTGAELRMVASAAGCLLLLNGRPEIAARIGADGVHLGDKSVSIVDARKIMGAGAIIGYSSHSIESGLRAADSGADFITFSPVFPTTSTSDPRAVTGIEPLLEMISLSRIPVFPLGGIGIEQAGILNSHGIRRAAVISAITEQTDIAAAVKDMISALEYSKT